MKANRRSFLQTTALACLTGNLSAAEKKLRWPIALFEKTLQFLPYPELAEILADLGFGGIEATVRNKGHIEPAHAVDKLPACVAALKKHGLTIPVMATSISRADQKHTETTLRAAAKLGIKTYRLAGQGYDAKKPILRQLDEIKRAWHDLAAMNKELGITGIYQNHAGSRNIGGQIWDLHHLLKDINPNQLGVAYDIRHAMVEGSSAWPISLRLIKPWIRAWYVKDFKFVGAKAQNVPMGEGIVAKSFYSGLQKDPGALPISLHTPHIRGSKPETIKTTIAAIRRDLKVLKSLLS